jgi:hypothetical protein
MTMSTARSGAGWPQHITKLLSVNVLAGWVIVKLCRTTLAALGLSAVTEILGALISQRVTLVFAAHFWRVTA